MDNYYFHMDNLSVGYNRKALIHDICIGIKTVSYTHLDVYKRQDKGCLHNPLIRLAVIM